MHGSHSLDNFVQQRHGGVYLGHLGFCTTYSSRLQGKEWALCFLRTYTCHSTDNVIHSCRPDLKIRPNACASSRC